jgi:ABC-type dipeptide/oligopeptide/nickel transport system ATPase subunit
MGRTFEDVPAVRTAVPLLVGLMGPSGGGKTFSALRLATGFQRITGGDIFVIDTEARRSLHYAERFKFRHLPFAAPFSPLDYLSAIEHCMSKGAKNIVVDSMSHEHEGPGGVLEMHDSEVQRMGGSERNNFPAWAKPKAERRRMINSILQQPCNFIFCFRAKEKTKPGSDKKLVDLGFMPIAGEEFVYEMTLNALLLPNAGGVPTWKSDYTGERQMIKLPEQFRQQLIGSDGPLSEDTGEMLARWSSGGSASAVTRTPSSPPPANTLLFNRTYAEWGGKPIAEAPADVVSKYIEALEAVLNDDAKAKAHAGTRKHLDAVQVEYERTLAEEAMGA